MARSVSPLLLVLLTLSTAVPAALAIRPGGEGEGKGLAKACDGTATLKECVGVLNSNPDGLAPRRLVELAYTYLVKDAGLLSNETRTAVAAAATKDEAARNCAGSLNATAKFYYDSLSRFEPVESEEKFTQAKGNLDELLGFPNDTGVACSDRDIHGEPFVEKMYNYEDMLKAMQGLMNKVGLPPPKETAPATPK